MKFRGLLAAVVVLLILGGALYWSEHHKPKETATSPLFPAIVHIDPASVTSVTLRQKGAAPIHLVQSSGKWRITAPAPYPADNSTVSEMLSALAPLNSVRVIQNKPTGLSQYGLNDPAVEVTIVSKDNKTHQILFGDATPTGDAVYALLSGDPRVFTAATYAKTTFTKSLSDLRDKRLVPVSADSVNTIDLSRPGQNVTFGRISNGWQIQRPKTYRTDTFQVDDLLQQLVGSRFDPSVSPADAAKAFAHATPLATVTVTGSDGKDTLEIRKAHDTDYARSSAVPEICEVDSSMASALNEALGRKLDDFRNKQLFDFGYTDPDKIEIHSGATNLFLTRSGNNWWSDGKKMDTDSVEALVTALRNLAAAKFTDAGFTSPQTSIAITSGNGKKIEKAQLQKSGDGAIAQRDDGPSLYFMDSVTMDGFDSALKGIKAAASAHRK